ncbi:hypothetical protein FOZ62_001734, partial [Perkinsus olseni]
IRARTTGKDINVKLHYPAAADYALGRNLRLDRLQMQQRVVGKDIAAQSRDIRILFQGSQAFNMPVERLSDSGKLLASGCFFAQASGFTHREEGIQAFFSTLLFVTPNMPIARHIDLRKLLALGFFFVEAGGVRLGEPGNQMPSSERAPSGSHTTSHMLSAVPIEQVLRD